MQTVNFTIIIFYNNDLVMTLRARTHARTYTHHNTTHTHSSHATHVHTHNTPSHTPHMRADTQYSTYIIFNIQHSIFKNTYMHTSIYYI